MVVCLRLEARNQANASSAGTVSGGAVKCPPLALLLARRRPFQSSVSRVSDTKESVQGKHDDCTGVEKNESCDHYSGFCIR